MSEDSEPRRRGRLGGTLRQLGDSILGLVETRISILSLELAQERGNLTRLVIGVLAILTCLQFAIITGVVFLVLAVDETYRMTVLGTAALTLLLAAAGGALGLRIWLKRRPPMFGTTIAELRKDRDWLRERL